MPQLLILQPRLWVVPLITTSSRPRLSSAFRFKRRQGAAGAGNSPSVSEGVAEGRGSNMSVKIPCVWLAARGDVLSSLRSQRVARFARAEWARCPTWSNYPYTNIILGFLFSDGALKFLICPTSPLVSNHNPNKFLNSFVKSGPCLPASVPLPDRQSPHSASGIRSYIP